MISSLQNTLKPSSPLISEVIMPPFEQFNSFTHRLKLPPCSHNEGFAMQASGSCPRSTYCIESRFASMPLHTCINHCNQILFDITLNISTMCYIVNYRNPVGFHLNLLWGASRCLSPLHCHKINVATSQLRRCLV